MILLLMNVQSIVFAPYVGFSLYATLSMNVQAVALLFSPYMAPAVFALFCLNIELTALHVYNAPPSPFATFPVKFESYAVASE